MIHIIITAYKEPDTIKKAISSILEQNIKDYNLYIVCPDKETKKEALKFKKVKYIKDYNKGKPAALNLVFKKLSKFSEDDILVLTDGDVFTGKNSINELLNGFDNNIGAVSGHPVSLNSRNNLFGFWAYVLTNIAHDLRLKNKDFVCSGYLMAIRNIIRYIPENSLSDDAVISNIILDNGFKISYAKDALVYVKYPNNFKDWIKQKIRSAGGYYQLKFFTKSNKKMRRSFISESLGFFMVFRYFKNLKEFIYTILLLFARFYLWTMIIIRLKLKKEDFNKIWKRVESTK